MAAAKLMKDIIKNRYVKEKLRNTRHYFKDAFFEKSPITVFFFFFQSSGKWVQIKLKLLHFHVSDTCRVSI